MMRIPQCQCNRVISRRKGPGKDVADVVRGRGKKPCGGGECRGSSNAIGGANLGVLWEREYSNNRAKDVNGETPKNVGNKKITKKLRDTT